MYTATPANPFKEDGEKHEKLAFNLFVRIPTLLPALWATGAACPVGWWGGYTSLSAWFQCGLLSLMPWECAQCERSGKAKHVNDERCAWV